MHLSVCMCASVHPTYKLGKGLGRKCPIPRVLRKDSAGRLDRTGKVERKGKQKKESSLMLRKKAKGCVGKSEMPQTDSDRFAALGKVTCSPGRERQVRVRVGMC